MGKLSIFKNAKVLVTGHNGFKGTWLTAWLIKLGAQVTGVSLDPNTTPSHYNLCSFDESVDNRCIDVCDLEALTNVVKEVQPDFVFHLAAQALVRRAYNDPVEAWKTNTIGTVNILEALRCLEKHCVAIMITSDKCYDNVEWEWGYRETDALGGSDPYSASKGSAELAIRSYIKSFLVKDGPVRVGIGRAGNVIGGGDWSKDRIIPDCVKAWGLNDSVSIRSPLATRPWQHVLEPLSGYLNLAIALNESSDLHGEPFNFGPVDSQNRSVLDLVTKMAESWSQVQWDDISSDTDGPYESGLLKLNCDKALHFLNWQPTWDFNETVRETAKWYQEYYTKEPVSIFDFTSKQIDLFMSDAKSKNRAWAN